MSIVSREKLAESCLTLDDAELLGITVMEAQTMNAYYDIDYPAVDLAYHDINGEPTGFTRLRFLGHPTLRYYQPPGTGVQAYIPRRLGFGLSHKPPVELNWADRQAGVVVPPPPIERWAQIRDDTSSPIIITEGELKAASACKYGVPTIGLGGVDAWRSSAAGHTWLPELEQIAWSNRKVVVCFDSDIVGKREVARAMNALVNALQDHGAACYLCLLEPFAGGIKCGLDDYLLSIPPAQRQERLDELVSTAIPFGSAKALFSYNERFCLVERGSVVVDLQNSETMHPRRDFLNVYENVRYRSPEIGPKGDIRYKDKPVAETWLKWPMRNTVGALSYEPGKPLYTEDSLNTWQGWPYQRKPGNTELFTQLLDHLFEGAAREDRQWFEQWLAYPIQHPGAKLATACLLYGTRQGTGKTLLAYTMMRLYGRNAVEIGEADLHSSFNEWQASRQFVVADEVTGSDSRHDADRLKSYITQERVTINQKGIRQYTIRDCANFLFTSNSATALYLEASDRRYFVHDVTAEPLYTKGTLQADYDDWYRSEQGLCALFDYLHTVDLTGFNPWGKAPSTQAKIEVHELGRSDIVSWVAGMTTGIDRELPQGFELDRELYTSNELCALYSGVRQHTRVTPSGVTRAFKELGVTPVNKRIPVVVNGTASRYLPIANFEHWAVATPVEIRDHVESAS